MNVQDSVAQAADAPDLAPPLPNTLNGALLEDFATIPNRRVLVLGRDIEIICQLIRHGCDEVTESTGCKRPEIASADIVIISCADTMAAAATAIVNARYALSGGGRLIMRTGPKPAERLRRGAGALLRFNGFSVLTIVQTGDRVVFTAELACDGR